MESIPSINRQLADLYGIDTESTQPMWRVVWSNDQLEKRLVDYTDSGVQLLYPEVREVKKYLAIRDRYILEHLVLIPVENQIELAGEMKSYEPIWTFETDKKEFLPPRMDACQFIIDLVLNVMNSGGMVKYVEADDKEERLTKLQEELFGNETEIGDALAYKEGIVVPQSYKKEN